MENIIVETKNAIEELIKKSGLQKGQLLVIGCSTSEVIGSKIGTNSVPEVADEIVKTVLKILNKKGIFLAAQCCEHLNRAIIVEKDFAEQKGLEQVNVIPQAKAGGSFATCVYKNMKNPVAVEEIKADAGLDIGQTLIGMHLKKVVVPLRLETKKIGEALLTAARVRPKFIGGNRAVYDENLM